MLQQKVISLPRMVDSKPFWFILFVLVAAASRLIVINGQYHIYSWDSGNFALACESFSLNEGRPHLPGYFLHIQLIRMLTAVTGDSMTSMNLFSVLYSSLAAGFLFLVVKRWFAQKDALLFTLLVITNPLVWYYGVVPEIYAFDLFFGICLIWMSFSPFTLTVTPAFMALGTGIRPSSGIFLLPVYVYFWYAHLKQQTISARTALNFHIPALIILLAWLGPLIISTGGIDGLWRVYRTNSPVEKISLWQSLFRLSSYLFYLIPPFILALIGRIFKKENLLPEESSENTYLDLHHHQLLNWWLWPSVLFFIFVHYSKGYLLISIIPGLLLLFWSVKKNILRQHLLLAAILIQSAVFLFQPFLYPDPQIYFARDERRLNPVRIWLDRTFSDYAMSRSRVTALQETYAFIAPLTGHEMILMNSKHYIFIDPTVMVTARALQAMFPENYFSKFLSGIRDYYGLHHDLEQEAVTGMREMLSQAIIVSRTDFVKEYLRILSPQVLSQNQHWTAFTVKQEDVIRLERIYRELFLRQTVSQKAFCPSSLSLKTAQPDLSLRYTHR